MWTEMTSTEFSVYEPIWVFLFVQNTSDDTLIVRYPDPAWDTTTINLRYSEGGPVPWNGLRLIGGPGSTRIPPHDTTVFSINLSSCFSKQDSTGNTPATMPEGRFQCEIRFYGRQVKGTQVFTVKGAPEPEKRLLLEFSQIVSSNRFLTDSVSQAVVALYDKNRDSNMASFLCHLAFGWAGEDFSSVRRLALELANRFPNSAYAEGAYHYLAKELPPKEYNLLPALTTRTPSTSIGRLLCKQALRDAKHH